MKASKLTIREVVLFGVLGALTFALKMCMALLPNIEPVSLLVIVFSVVFGWKALYPTYVYVVMEILYWGIGTWNMNYLYIWGILAVVALLLRKADHPLVWAMVSGIYGLAFGLLCSPVDIAMGGLSFAITKWASGIPFDIAHCIGNFFMALILFKPLRILLTKLYGKMRR
jgi:energy-coupling factor transport system substrate-specific component